MMQNQCAIQHISEGVSFGWGCKTDTYVEAQRTQRPHAKFTVQVSNSFLSIT